MDKKELYNQAKDAYYNGTPIMTDYEFDELEYELGLENKSYVGSKNNPSYTIEHPIIMGSLSKVQVKKEDDGSVQWKKYFEEIDKYISKFCTSPLTVITPKYDGCSFEIYYKCGKIVSISTRGDGYFGKDITKHITNQANEALKNIKSDDVIIFRGEVLINKNVFSEKYSEFVNPRSFVSGILNRDYCNEVAEICKDLSIVIYDVRKKDKNVDEWYEIDWFFYLKEMNRNEEYIPNEYLPKQYIINAKLSEYYFEKIYKEFDKYRESECEYALDGIVIKPIKNSRVNNTSDARPKDCVAVKFIPMLEETEIIDIEWSTGKTNELRPVIKTKGVIMDGKLVTRASGHNYGNMIENKISIGTKVILSLAGDIIPFIYKVTDSSNFDVNKLNIPKDSYVDGCHLYKIMDEEEVNKQKFIQSAEALSIPNIGSAAAEVIYNYVSDKKYINILECYPFEIENALSGKLGLNARESFEKYTNEISLSDIIVSCTFISCGRKVSDAIVNYLVNGKKNFEHLAEKAYSWCFNSDSDEMKLLTRIMNKWNMTFDSIVSEECEYDKIPVILTGEPNNYSTKKDFLNSNPQYVITNSWKEVKIVFTNDLNSNTSKMNKAREKGIKIELY